jgi:hypothetical protein
MTGAQDYGSLPPPPAAFGDSESNSVDLAKLQYTEQLDAWLERYKQQLSDSAVRAALEATRFDTVRAADTTLVQALHAAYIATSQSAIDRSLTRINVVTASIGAITTIYTGLIALVYAAKSDSGKQLTGTAIIPAVFLALALLLVAVYAAMFKNSTSEGGPLVPSGAGDGLRESRLDTFMNWCFATIGARIWALHAGIISLGFGVVSLPVPFIKLPNGIPLIILIIGLLATVLVGVITAANSKSSAETTGSPELPAVAINDLQPPADVTGSLEQP